MFCFFRDSWLNHVRNLLSVACHHIKCLTSNHDDTDDAKILITTYNILEKNIDKLLEKNFGVIIFDESHTLKNQKAKCTIMADRIAKQAKRIILTTGTPALSRPLELFTQLKMLDRNFFNFMEFSKFVNNIKFVIIIDFEINIDFILSKKILCR